MTIRELPTADGLPLTGDRVWDVAVVGAGPAGAMVALELARLGRTVVLLDRQPFPRWKVCGACLSPGAQTALRRAGLGEVPLGLGAEPLEILRLRGWAIQTDIPLRGSMAVSRAALDNALVEAARAQGVVFAPGIRVSFDRVAGNTVHLRTEGPEGALPLTARIAVAADGLRSGILARTGGGARPGEGSVPARGKVGLGASFAGGNAAYGTGAIHMAVGEEGYVGLVRTEDGRLNVAAAVRREALRGKRSPGALVTDLLTRASFPPLEGEPLEGWRGTPNLAYNPRDPGGERVFAVGDAAGYVEPFTGEGMSWALAGARTLAPIADSAVTRWSAAHLDEWRREYLASVGRAQRLCRGAAWTLNRPRLSRAALRLLHAVPQVAAPFVHGVAAPPPSHHGSPS